MTLDNMEEKDFEAALEQIFNKIAGDERNALLLLVNRAQAFKAYAENTTALHKKQGVQLSQLQMLLSAVIEEHGGQKEDDAAPAILCVDKSRVVEERVCDIEFWEEGESILLRVNRPIEGVAEQESNVLPLIIPSAAGAKRTVH